MASQIKNDSAEEFRASCGDGGGELVVNEIKQSNSDTELGSDDLQEVQNSAEEDTDECETASGEDGESGDYSNEDEGSENESDDDESEDESDDDEPPVLKYTRITSKLPASFFQRDSISCCNFSDNVFLFGTQAGILHLTHTDLTTIQTLKCHRSSILSIYCDGTNFATASMDGTVIIGSLKNPSQLTSFDFKRPINSVVLDSNYKNNMKFISGGMAGEVILSQRNWLGNRMDITITKGNGPILGIFKLNKIIFWMNDAGISFYEISTKSHLLNTPFPIHNQNSSANGNETRPDLFKPHVHFPEVDRIVVGWGNHIWLFKISNANDNITDNNTNNNGNINNQEGSNIASILSSAASSFRASPDLQIELEHYFPVNMLISGIVSFKDDQLMCLGFDIDDINNIQFNSKIPQLRQFDITTGEEINSEEIMVKNYQKLSINDYHLGKFIHSNSSPEYFLISATDCIRIQELSLKDHYEWHLARKHLLTAWEISRYINIPERNILQLGIDYLVNEIEKENWECIGDKIATIFTSSRDHITSNTNENNTSLDDFLINQWQGIILKLINMNQISINLVENIPQESRFDKSVYDQILYYYLDKLDEQEFSRLINTWDINIYSKDKIEKKLEEKLINDTANIAFYRNQIIGLYLKSGQYSKALTNMIEGKDKRCLDLLIENQELLSQFYTSLWDIILIEHDGETNTIPSLSKEEMKVRFTKSIHILSLSTKYYSIKQIINIFQDNYAKLDLNLLLLIVLENIEEKDYSLIRPFEDVLIKLYSQYNTTKLLTFLKDKNNYDIENAIEICSAKAGLYNELIYLWGRIGDTKKALSIIIEEMDNPELAVEYVKSWGDVSLWDFLITYSIGKPKFIKVLLKNYEVLGDKYINVIKVIDDNTKIDSLKSILCGVLNDKTLSLTVKKDIFHIIDDELIIYSNEYLELRDQGKIFKEFGTPT